MDVGENKKKKVKRTPIARYHSELAYKALNYVKSMSWIVNVEEGLIGVCVRFGAPIYYA